MPSTTTNLGSLQSNQTIVTSATDPTSIATYVTNLPSSPVDGQEVYYAADAANGVIWHLRYRSGATGSYKWEYIGGGVLFAEGLANQAAGGAANNTTSATYVTLGSPPSVTVPLAGDYDILLGSVATSGGTQSALVSYSINGGTPSDSDAIFGPPTTGSWYTTVSRVRRKTGLAAATSFAARYRSYSGDTCYFKDTWITAKPVRVG